MRQESAKSNVQAPDRRAFFMGIAATLGALPIFYANPSAVMAQTIADVAAMSADKAHRAATSGEIILIDIRRPEEWLETGVAEGAIGLDMTRDNFVASLVSLRQANPDTPLALICRTGNRTGFVTQRLAAQGFPGLVDVREGMAGGPNGLGWLRRGLPIYDGTPENVAARRQTVLGCTDPQRC